MYKSVFVDGRITNPKTGNTADLRLFGEGASSIPFLESVTIKSGWSVDMDMSIKLAPTYRDALALMSKDQEWFRLGNTLALRWGYADVNGATSDWHMGFMMLPEPSFGEEISIAIPAQGYGFNPNRVSRMRCWGSPDKPRTFKSVAEEIAQKYGMTVEFELLNEKAIEVLVNLKRTGLVQGGRTDLQFVAFEVANVGAQLIVRNNKFYIVDGGSPLTREEDVAATFQMYGKIDVWNNVFPLESFDPDAMGTLFLQSHQGMAFFGVDPNDDPEDEVVAITATGLDSDNNAYSSDKTANTPTEDGAPTGLANSDGTPNSAKATVSTDIRKMEAGRYIPIAMSGKEHTAQAEALVGGARDSDAADEGIKVNFSTIALPWVIPGMYVRLEGLGDFFSAVYFMWEREVTIDEGGATMSCVAGTKGFPGLEASVDSFVGNVKKHETPPEGDPTVIAIAPNPYEGE